MKNMNEKAVSPVIGVILMVAITVILAAIIAAFVFGMSGNISKTKIVATTISQPDENSIIVTYVGGQDARFFQGANVTINEVRNTSKPIPPYVGSSIRYFPEPGKDFNGADHVVVTGWFTDGSQQVILDATI